MIDLGRRRGWWLIALGAIAVVWILSAAGVLRPLENAAADLRARLLMHEVRTDIVIVGIDAASLEALDQWPWPRRNHGKLLEQLNAAAPRSVFLDIDFSSPSNALDDAVFDAALAKRRNFPVVLPTYFQYASSADRHLIISRPLPRFARNTDLVGVNAQAGGDGLTREWHNFWTVDGERMTSVIDPHRLVPEERAVPIDFRCPPDDEKREQRAVDNWTTGQGAMALGNVEPWTSNLEPSEHA